MVDTLVVIPKEYPEFYECRAGAGSAKRWSENALALTETSDILIVVQ
jgi:hypothetical protein